MRIDSFVFNWLDYAPAAEQLERALQPLSSAVHVINIGPPHPGWVNLDTQAYFTAKWHAALQRFHGDVLFNVQADVTVPDMAALFASAREAFQTGDVGVYTPDVSFTNWAFEPTLLPRYADGLYAVPLTDQTCWFLDARVIRNAPFPAPESNRYGWGIDVLSLASSIWLGLRVVRDYRHRVNHPQGTGYPSHQAHEELEALLDAMPAAGLLYQAAWAILERHRAHRKASAVPAPEAGKPNA